MELNPDVRKARDKGLITVDEEDESVEITEDGFTMLMVFLSILGTSPNQRMAQAASGMLKVITQLIQEGKSRLN